MVKVYAVVLGLGFVALVTLLMGSTLAGNVDKPDRDPNNRIGPIGRALVGVMLGFGMGGMAGEFSPMDLSWPVALVLAIAGGAIGGLWVRYSDRVAVDG